MRMLLDAEAMSLSEEGILADVADGPLAASSVRAFRSVIALVIANLDYGDHGSRRFGARAPRVESLS